MYHQSWNMTVYWSHESSFLSILSCSPAWAQGTGLKKSLAAKRSWCLAMTLIQGQGIGASGTVAAPKQEIQRFWFGCMWHVCLCCEVGWIILLPWWLVSSFCQCRVIAAPSPDWLADTVYSLSYSCLLRPSLFWWRCLRRWPDVLLVMRCRSQPNHWCVLAPWVNELQLSVWRWAHHIANLFCRWTFQCSHLSTCLNYPVSFAKVNPSFLPLSHSFVMIKNHEFGFLVKYTPRKRWTQTLPSWGYRAPSLASSMARREMKGSIPSESALADWDLPYHSLQCKLGKVWQFMVLQCAVIVSHQNVGASLLLLRPGAAAIKGCLLKIRHYNPKCFIIEEVTRLQSGCCMSRIWGTLQLATFTRFAAFCHCFHLQLTFQVVHLWLKIPDFQGVT